MPCRAMSIIPLEVEAPINMPIAATSSTILNLAALAPTAGERKLTASFATPTLRSKTANTSRKPRNHLQCASLAPRSEAFLRLNRGVSKELPHRLRLAHVQTEAIFVDPPPYRAHGNKNKRLLTSDVRRRLYYYGVMRMRTQFACSSKNVFTSRAALQPMAAAVIAWR